MAEGFDFAALPVGSCFTVGEAVLEMTQVGKECHSDCNIKRQTGECIMPREGVFARVLKGGRVRKGEELTLLPFPEDFPLRAAVITLSDLSLIHICGASGGCRNESHCGHGCASPGLQCTGSL